MNKFIERLIFSLGIFLNRIFFINSDQLSSRFLALNFQIPIDSCLVYKNSEIKNKFFCLQICLMDTQCDYAKYEKKECSLYAKQGNINTNLLSEKIIYQKAIENELIGECSGSTAYWSLSKNSCLPCKTGFFKNSELPNFCYHKQPGPKDFDESKAYCESKGAFLFRPKTQKEREFFVNTFSNSRVFVDSRITRIGEIYKWPDGSYVCGFDNNQPDNLLNLSENVVEIVSHGKFNNIPSSHQNELTICQHD
ncbi:unnamed protein product [Brachionus calyciflorus]|uniref:C-type lectin domain-containing protein n=1 Tax=Brachionus calyciflorus TaxID=104777 RepID=A0A813Y4P4_9BILA|nr:unnamed protein product [Brachionus calyciflorus]